MKLRGDFLREWWPVNLSTNEAQQSRVIDLNDGAYEIQNVRSGRACDDFFIPHYARDSDGCGIGWMERIRRFISSL